MTKQEREEFEKKGGTRKISDVPYHAECIDPHHVPPPKGLFSPGVYEHVCVGCGRKTVFTVPFEEKPL